MAEYTGLAPIIVQHAKRGRLHCFTSAEVKELRVASRELRDAYASVSAQLRQIFKRKTGEEIAFYPEEDVDSFEMKIANDLASSNISTPIRILANGR